MDNYGTQQKTRSAYLAEKASTFRAAFCSHQFPSWLNLVERWFGELSRQCIRRAHSSASRILQKAIREFLDAWNTKIPNLLFGRLRWNRSWKSCLAVRQTLEKIQPDALCHGAERRAIKLSIYFADTTLVSCPPGSRATDSLPTLSACREPS